MSETTEIATTNGVALYRTSTDAAAICKDIVIATASNIQGKRYVGVEGWQAIAIAHGCTASSGDVKKEEDGGYSAVGQIRRMDTGAIIATAEGYVGPDEVTWFGGQSRGKTLPKRPDYAIRAMAQTRAISRACRSAFAHVVVMMNAGLQTTPAEEVPAEGFSNGEVITGTIISKDEDALLQKYRDAALNGTQALRKFHADIKDPNKSKVWTAYCDELKAAASKMDSELVTQP